MFINNMKILKSRISENKFHLIVKSLNSEISDSEYTVNCIQCVIAIHTGDLPHSTNEVLRE